MTDEQFMEYFILYNDAINRINKVLQTWVEFTQEEALDLLCAVVCAQVAPATSNEVKVFQGLSFMNAFLDHIRLHKDGVNYFNIKVPIN